MSISIVVLELQLHTRNQSLSWICHFILAVNFTFLVRLLYRSRQRGYLELDLILGKWTEENIEKLDGEQLKSLVEVLDLVRTINTHITTKGNSFIFMTLFGLCLPFAMNSGKS